MELHRAGKFGIYASIGFILISMIMFALIREIQTGVEAGTFEGDLTILFILIGATLVGMTFLFTLIGEYIDRSLESRGLADREH